MDLEQLLKGWQEGRLTTLDIEQRLIERYAPSQRVSDAVVDLDRQRRCGFPEVVFGHTKSPATVLEIVVAQRQHQQASLVTRASLDQLHALQGRFPEARWNPVARTISIGQVRPSSSEATVAVLAAGTTDRPVAEEAAETALWMGCSVSTVLDVGVAGPHRLIERLPEFRDAKAVVVVAGMEGALPSVVAGWVACPVIAVPTSVGYGAHLQGLAPLLSMLTSCAANVAVVNIDAGFKGGYVAGLIATANARQHG
jgi:pyridinium-3,5-biscarboxylic acid mononucleotide synthase